MISEYSAYGKLWALDPELTFLNHGSFGSTPLAILEQQSKFRLQMEREPIRFFKQQLEPLWDASRQAVADFSGTLPDHVILTRNATMGVNLILQSLELKTGDEVLTTNHLYGACIETLNVYAAKKGFKLNIVNVPFPLKRSDEVLTAIESGINKNTRLIVIDHVTSVSGIVFPLAQIIQMARASGIEVLVDGAHAMGMLDLNLDELGADYYAGNCHKWICAPKGAAMVYVHPEKQHKISPLQISYQYDRSADWIKKFYWSGTDDFSANLCIPAALELMEKIYGSWELLRVHNRSLTLQAKRNLEDVLQVSAAAPDDMIGSMANILLGKTTLAPYCFNYTHPLQELLYEKYKIVVPLMIFPKHDPQLWIRISAQAYNDISQYQYLGECLKAEMQAGNPHLQADRQADAKPSLLQQSFIQT